MLFKDLTRMEQRKVLFGLLTDFTTGLDMVPITGGMDRRAIDHIVYAAAMAKLAGWGDIKDARPLVGQFNLPPVTGTLTSLQIWRCICGHTYEGVADGTIPCPKCGRRGDGHDSSVNLCIKPGCQEVHGGRSETEQKILRSCNAPKCSNCITLTTVGGVVQNPPPGWRLHDNGVIFCPEHTK